MPKPDRQRGQGLTEYAVILALVLVAIIGIAVTFGDDLRQMFDNSGSNAPATINAPKVESATDGGTTGGAR
jgi:Flp pilus assembly pilin Flp